MLTNKHDTRIYKPISKHTNNTGEANILMYVCVCLL